MKIVGHRGAAKLALENTLESIRAARQAGVDAIEFDIRKTKDDHFVLCHDVATGRISNQSLAVSEHTLAELKALTLRNGERLPTLQEALAVAKDTPVLIEAKGDQWSATLAAQLAVMQHPYMAVIALNHSELIDFHKRLPEIPVYAVQRFHLVDGIQTLDLARSAGLTGVDINFWLLNPFTYWLAKRYKLAVIVYTVNYSWIARFLHFFFPTISITTDCPDKLQRLRT